MAGEAILFQQWPNVLFKIPRPGADRAKTDRACTQEKQWKRCGPFHQVIGVTCKT
jgi:hypothetical protein